MTGQNQIESKKLNLAIDGLRERMQTLETTMLNSPMDAKEALAQLQAAMMSDPLALYSV